MTNTTELGKHGLYVRAVGKQTLSFRGKQGHRLGFTLPRMKLSTVITSFCEQHCHLVAI